MWVDGQVMRRIALLVVGFLSLVLAQNANAAVSDQIRIANWSGGSYFNDRSKRFDHCSASATNSGEIAISYSIDRQYRWSLTFSHPAWNFSNGLSLNLVLKSGERDGMRGHAVAVESRVLQVQVEDNISLFAMLRIGGQLRVTAGGLTFEFPLADSDDVLSALTQCAMRHLGIAKSPKSKRSAPERSARPPLVADPASHDETLALANDVIGYARIPDARILAADEVPADLRGAAVWKAGLITSSVSVVRSNNADRVDEVAVQLVERDARKCQGGFFFVLELDAIDRAPVARVFTSCKMFEAVTSVYHLAVPRRQGGAYLVSATGRGSGFAGAIQRQAEQVDAKVRAVITVALKQLEREFGAARPSE